MHFVANNQIIIIINIIILIGFRFTKILQWGFSYLEFFVIFTI